MITQKQIKYLVLQ